MLSKYVLISALITSTLLFAQKPMFQQSYSPRIANYEISVKLDPESKKLYGSQILTWRNDSNDYINDLQFHLYLNAFKNDLSTFMRESSGSHRGQRLEKEDGWGWIEIESMILKDQELKHKFEFIQPDDGNCDDQTVLRVPLDQPVNPREVISIKIDFVARLPQVFARTGYKGDFYMVGQWFPKIGVYEEAGERYAETGQWNCHQFHLNSEFFSDYGVYEVEITVPEDYIVGATGVLIDEKHEREGEKSLTFYCEDVHDFAWTADPNYIVMEDQWRHVKIKFLAHPGRETQVERHIGSAKIALQFFDEWYGPYPYPTLTIVDPAYGGFGAAGMEYPTLITAGAFWMLPMGIRLTEMVTIHEFGHNYWYGIMGSNEFEEAWLDEGITTYSEIKIMEKYYGGEEGSTISLFGLNIDDVQASWYSYHAGPRSDAIYNYSWMYGRGGYGRFSYSKPGLMLLTLQNYLGEEVMKKVMQAYYDRYSFKHPTTRDFINTVNDISGQDLNWFFDQVLYGTNVLDYKISSISSKRVSAKPRGVFGNPLENVAEDTTSGEVSGPDSSSDNKTTYKNKVIVAREGEVVFPVEVLITFEYGEQIWEKWDGKDRYMVYEYESDKRVIAAEVDPERKVWLDVNFLNNGKNLKSADTPVLKYSTRYLFWMQNLLQLLAIFG
jgi:hypothetical protein